MVVLDTTGTDDRKEKGKVRTVEASVVYTLTCGLRCFDPCTR